MEFYVSECFVFRMRLNCVGVFDVVSFDPNLQSGSTQMERCKVSVTYLVVCQAI